MKLRRSLAILVLFGFHAGMASAADVVVHAGHLIDGTTMTRRDKVSVVIHDDKVVEVVDGFVDRPGATSIDLADKTVLPGLIDSHVHLLLDLSRGNTQLQRAVRSTYDDLLVGVVNARTTLMAGFTSVRDVGGYTPASVALKRAQQAGEVPGPRMWVAGSILTPTGGHADPANGYDLALAKPEWKDGVVDTPEEAMRAVREHHRAGTDLIKIVPSGGVASIGDDPHAQLMTDDQIRAVVETAHVLHMKVAAHAHGEGAVLHSARLDVDSIEHGTFGTPEGYKAMKEHGTYLVPTLIAASSIVELARLHPEAVPVSVAAKARGAAGLARLNVLAAWKAGVKIAFGTDAGVMAHGINAQEFPLMVDAGLTPAASIEAATANAAALIGAPDLIGAIKPGGYADMIAVDGDPLSDVTLLQHVPFVMQGGTIVKLAGKPQI